MKVDYFSSINMIERLYRLSLEVIKLELNKMGIHDINNAQCVVLCRLGKRKIITKDAVNLGYYLGSNFTYNLKKMVKNGYLIQEKGTADGRETNLCLSEKGIKLYNDINKVFENHLSSFKEFVTSDGKNNDNMFIDLYTHFYNFEKFWLSLLKGSFNGEYIQTR